MTIEIAGTNPASQFDNLIVNGTINLGGATLAASLVSFTPAATDSFTIIDNDLADAVTGTFSGLAEQQVLMVGNTPFQITYQGGAGGNNVVLTPANVVQVAVSPCVVAEDGTSNLVIHVYSIGAVDEPTLTVQFHGRRHGKFWNRLHANRRHVVYQHHGKRENSRRQQHRYGNGRSNRRIRRSSAMKRSSSRCPREPAMWSAHKPRRPPARSPTTILPSSPSTT